MLIWHQSDSVLAILTSVCLGQVSDTQSVDIEVYALLVSILQTSNA